MHHAFSDVDTVIDHHSSVCVCHWTSLYRAHLCFILIFTYIYEHAEAIMPWYAYPRHLICLLFFKFRVLCAISWMNNQINAGCVVFVFFSAGTWRTMGGVLRIRRERSIVRRDHQLWCMAGVSARKVQLLTPCCRFFIFFWEQWFCLLVHWTANLSFQYFQTVRLIVQDFSEF